MAELEVLRAVSRVYFLLLVGGRMDGTSVVRVLLSGLRPEKVKRRMRMRG